VSNCDIENSDFADFMSHCGEGLEALTLTGCERLVNISSALESFENIRKISVRRCRKLQSIDLNDELCAKLEVYEIDGCTQGGWCEVRGEADGVFKAPRAFQLKLQQCTNLRVFQLGAVWGTFDLRYLYHCVGLQFLRLDCELTSLAMVGSFRGLTELKIALGFIGCDGAIPSLRDCALLESIELSLVHFSDLGAMEISKDLRRLSLRYCDGIENLFFLHGYSRLDCVEMISCARMKDLSELRNQKSLSTFVLSSCFQVQDVSFGVECPNLRRVRIKDVDYRLDVSYFGACEDFHWTVRRINISPPPLFSLMTWKSLRYVTFECYADTEVDLTFINGCDILESLVLRLHCVPDGRRSHHEGHILLPRTATNARGGTVLLEVVHPLSWTI